MNPILSTMEHRGDTAVRLDVRGLAEARPWLVDEWLITSACGHPECQVVLALGRIIHSAGDDGVLGKYSHMIFLAEHVGGQLLTAQALFEDALSSADVEVATLVEHPIAVPDDERAREVSHSLARSLLAGVLPWRPETETQVNTWQMTIVMALLANHTPNGHEARIDPRKTEAVEPLGAGFGIHPRRERAGWTGQDAEEVRDREHG